MRLATMRTRGPVIRLSGLILCCWLSLAAAQESHEWLVDRVEAVGMTVADMERSVAFYTNVLAFEQVSDVEVTGSPYEHLQGVFGLRMRVVRLRLGEEFIDLTEYLAPRGRPFPVDSRSHDRWFQHMAIIVTDMDRAYRWLRQHKVEHASSGPQRLPDWNPKAGGIKAFYFKDTGSPGIAVIAYSYDRVREHLCKMMAAQVHWGRRYGQLHSGTIELARCPCPLASRDRARTLAHPRREHSRGNPVSPLRAGDL